MNIRELAKNIASQKNAPKAYKYDLFLRDFDNKVELLGLVDDPTYDMKDFVGREMLFPRKWVTLRVLDADMKVAV
jgi:hypothetical protein|tara:strand:+ start:123 stop:347 length:225 start_codon:yes stop_codon:yes gene_type:complete